MLIKYKNDYSKIAMGLLSFIPELKNINNLNKEMDWYRENENLTLYLWKNNKGDFIGIIGVEIGTEIVLVRHLSISPNERNDGLASIILNELQEIFPEKKIMGNLEMNQIIKKWEQKKHE